MNQCKLVMDHIKEYAIDCWRETLHCRHTAAKSQLYTHHCNEVIVRSYFSIMLFIIQQAIVDLQRCIATVSPYRLETSQL
jgi:hypothetical protein